MEREKIYDEEGRFIHEWAPRAKRLELLRELMDYDWFDCRSRHSTGWKEHKCRHQWEYRVREQEKHLKNRIRKAARRERADDAPE